MGIKPIRVMIIDDSLFFREFMSRSLSVDSSIEVVGIASDPMEALTQIPEKQPNILTLDIEAENFQFRPYIRKLRQEYPGIQIVIISPQSTGVFEALKAGAMDFVAKPAARLNMDNAAFMRDVIGKIKTVYSGASARSPFPAAAVGRPATVPGQAFKAAAKPQKPPPAAPVRPAAALPGTIYHFPSAHRQVIAIGASTGGTEAILAVVRDLPAATPGIVIVQHMPPLFTRMYAERLDKMCRMSAKEAENGDRVQPGLILVAQGDKQMRLGSDARGYFVKVEDDEKVSGHRPSVDALFESVAHVARENAVGVILTGMGGDGAMNLLKMREAGAYTIGQDEASCVVYGMPMVAYNMGAVTDQLPLDAIPAAILRHLST